MNPIFNAFRNTNNLGNNNPISNFSNFMKQFNQFRQNFQGDPKQQVEHLINSGAMSQEQFEKFTEIAKQFQGMIG